MLLQVSFLLLGLFSIVANGTIIIIGAGSSGIAAATRLLENGITDILILEAENRIGGRIKTVKFGENVQDLGAQWCHGEINNVVFEMAQPLGLLEHSKYSYENFDFINANGSYLPHDTVNEIFNHFRDFPELYNASEPPLNLTYGECITEAYANYIKGVTDLDPDDKKSVFEFLHLMDRVLDACDSWMELPVKTILAYDEMEGHQGNSWKGRGYQTILDVLMKKIPDPSKELPYVEKVQLNKEVVNIKWNNENNQVSVECKDGSKYEAERVIVTTSLGVLKEQYQTLFTPPLPATKVKSIKYIGFGVVDKLVLEFPHQWWPNNTDGFFIIWSKLNQSPAVQNLLNDHPWLREVSGIQVYDYQPNNLLGWILSDSARLMELQDENIVKEKLMELIRLLLGDKFSIPEPKSFIRTQWDSNPHFRGSYSYNTFAMEIFNATNADLAAPLRNSKNIEVVQFAGEATHSTRYATVHGAIETGWREADRILKSKV